MKDRIRNAVIWFCQFPQNIIGFVLTRKATKNAWVIGGEYIKYYTVPRLFHSAVSLGDYIIFDERVIDSKTAVKHEWGHQKQSLKLGWFYLPLIGFPSLCGNIFDRVFHKKWARQIRERWYYSQPWEAWADRLGKVNRYLED